MSNAHLLNQAREARLCGQRERMMAASCSLPLVVLERANEQIKRARALTMQARQVRMNQS